MPSGGANCLLAGLTALANFDGFKPFFAVLGSGDPSLLAMLNALCIS
jgi:hypothetical protein